LPEIKGKAKRQTPQKGWKKNEKCKKRVTAQGFNKPENWAGGQKKNKIRKKVKTSKGGTERVFLDQLYLQPNSLATRTKLRTEIKK